LTWKGFDLKRYGATLDTAQAKKIKIWGDAYIQRPQTGFDVDEEGKEVEGKHNRYLRLLEAMMSRDITGRLQAARTYEEAYRVLRDFPSPAIGNFAAMQWLTDINYRLKSLTWWGVFADQTR
jgi:alpha-glutamyl/putrescinyl thymine pyrophosphorylase clade 1